MHIQDCWEWSDPLWHAKPGLDWLTVRGGERDRCPGSARRRLVGREHNLLQHTCLAIKQHQPLGGGRILHVSVDISIRAKEKGCLDKASPWLLKGYQSPVCQVIEIEPLPGLPELTEEQTFGIWGPVRGIHLSLQVTQHQFFALPALCVPDPRPFDSAPS